MPKINLFALLPQYLTQKGKSDKLIYDFKEYDDHIAVILSDFSKLIIPKADLLAIHNAAAKVEAVAAAVVDITESLLVETQDVASHPTPASTPKRGKK